MCMYISNIYLSSTICPISGFWNEMVPLLNRLSPERMTDTYANMHCDK